MKSRSRPPIGSCCAIIQAAIDVPALLGQTAQAAEQVGGVDLAAGFLRNLHFGHQS